MTEIKTLVMYAPIKDVDMTAPLVPSERQREIDGCKNEMVRREKYLVWKLLEKAVKRCFNLDIANLTFTKNEFGQWLCPDFFFSLSHTAGAVCVAVSRHKVGVDIEKIKEVRPELSSRFLTGSELELIKELDLEERGRFFLEAWVKKESIFKMHGGESLMPRRIDTVECDVIVESVCVFGEKYLIALASENQEKYEIIYTEEI